MLQKKTNSDEIPLKSTIKKPVHKRDLSAHFFDATRLSDGAEYGKINGKRETSYPIQHARPLKGGFAIPIARASPSRISDSGFGGHAQSCSHKPMSPAANVGNKHRRVYSGGRSNPAVAHRRINSVGDSTPIDRQGYNGYYTLSRSGYTHRREDSAGLDILSAVADESKEQLGFDTVQKRETRRKIGIWDAPVQTSQTTERRMDPPQPVGGAPSYEYHPALPPIGYSNRRIYGYTPPSGYSPPPSHPQAVPYSAYNPHEAFYPPGRYNPHHGYQSQLGGTTYQVQYTPMKEGNSYSRSNPHQHSVHGYETKPPQRLDTEEKLFRKDSLEWKAGTSTGSQTFLTAISVGDENKTVIPAPTNRTTSTNIEQNADHPPIPTSVGHHRKLSSYSSLGTLMGSSIFQDPEQPSSVSGSRGHHRSNSSSVSLLQGLEAEGDMFFLSNVHAPTGISHGVFNTSTKSYSNSRPLEATSQVNVVSSNEPSGHILAAGGTSKRIRRKCTVDGCSNRVVQGGLCISHGAKRKTCKHPGCTKNVKKAGLCSTHGPARKRCEHEGCKKVAVQGGKCIAHGAKKKLCKIAGCTKQAILAGMCKKHHDANTLTVSSKGKLNNVSCVVINDEKGAVKKPTHTRGLSIFQEMSAESVQTLLSAESNSTGRHPLKDN
mmetsp:Transcript_6597/g.7203  ORF Transcript_6597/g.7203 Transcript_6597/m.7203 type:complete len:659 (+) Transcript_6597:633-2609(+)